jgi:N-formylglutamate deformylase
MSYTLHPGTTPLIISMPHVGTLIAEDIQRDYQPRALLVEDTDWFLDRLYAFAADLGASLLIPRESRYVIDLNRPSDNTPMYTGSNNTELVPTRFFTGEPLYIEGHEPDGVEVMRRIDEIWQPYHDALANEVQRIKSAHGHAVLFDAHSIKSELPWLFDGTLPNLNLGTVDGHSCAPGLRQALIAAMATQQRFTHVTDGRFKGGHITRHYGQPAQNVHAVQLEMCWRTYMDEGPPATWGERQASEVTPLLRKLIRTMIDWRRQ